MQGTDSAEPTTRLQSCILKNPKPLNFPVSGIHYRSKGITLNVFIEWRESIILMLSSFKAGFKFVITL